MHTLTLRINSDDVWQQLLSYVNKLPATEVSVQEETTILDKHTSWEAMRQALPMLANLDLVREQPQLQSRDLF